MSQKINFNRREFLYTTGLAVTGSVLAMNMKCSTTINRPNVLWITCEDISPDLGCYGDPVARTPNLDAFARESVRYTNAFSVSGVCAPSRAGLIWAAMAIRSREHPILTPLHENQYATQTHFQCREYVPPAGQD